MGKEFVGSIGPTNPTQPPVVPSPGVPKKTFLTNINGKDGAPGEDAYEIAVENGFEGTEIEWLESLDGVDGTDAYGMALLEGFIGTRAEWLSSLRGKSAYELAVISGFTGTLDEWLEELRGPQGDSAYAIAQAEGFSGTKDEWIPSLKGEEGDNAYEVAVSAGFPGTKEQWLDSLEGLDGDDGFSPYLTKNATHIQIQYFTIDGEPASEVMDLVALAEISGTDGRDPYKIALENGFVGTEAQWIASLRGIDGYTPVLTVTSTHVQLHYTRGDEETEPEDLISLEDLTGKPGADGWSPELQKTATHIQWRLKRGTDTTTWTNLVLLTDLKGEAGKGLPAGGTTGQVPVKKSATDYDVAWANAPQSTKPADVQIFEAVGWPSTTHGQTTKYEWTKPEGARLVRVFFVAAGAAGGSGRRGLLEENTMGGAGGSAGSWGEETFPASMLPDKVAIEVGVGGRGGLPVTTDSTNGMTGIRGGWSQFGVLRANGQTDGGGGGAANTNTNTGGGQLGYKTTVNAPNGGLAVVGSRGNPGNGSPNSWPTPTAGGGGGSHSGQYGRSGGGGGPMWAVNHGGSPGALENTGAAAPNSVAPFGGLFGFGGGGGGAGRSDGLVSVEANQGGRGGDGSTPGGGGGGGGASKNGYMSGGGGHGGNGIVIVTTWF